MSSSPFVLTTGLRGFIMKKIAITALKTLLWKELMRKQIGK